MRKRGGILILVAIPAWVYVARFLSQVARSGFAYELGSVAMPYPPMVRLAQAFAIFVTLMGLIFLIFDFVQWMKDSGVTNR